MRVFELPKGGPREQGQAHGETFRPLIAEIASIRTQLLVAHGIGSGGNVRSVAEARALAEHHLPMLEAFDLDLFNELLGVAEGAALHPADIVILNHYTDLKDLCGDGQSIREGDKPSSVDSSESDDNCSALFAATPAGSVIGQTWDMHGSALPFVMMLGIPATDDAPAAWTLSLTGCLGMAGLNEAGIAITINNLSSTDATIGVVWSALVRRVLQCRDAASGRDVILDAHVGAGHHYLIASEREAYGIETSGTRKEMVFEHRGNDSDVCFAHTNHCLSQVVDEHTTIRPGSTTRERYSTIADIVREEQVRDRADLWYRVLGSHREFPQSVSTWMASPQQPHAMATCGGIAVDLAARNLWACAGEVHRSRPLQFDFEAISAPSQSESSSRSPADSVSKPYLFTWTAQRDAKGIDLCGGEGSFFFTKSDSGSPRRVLDMGSLSYQANAGHGCQRIVARIRNQAQRLCLASPHANYPEKEELARTLLRLAPDGFNKVFFTLGGADANEHALKIARMFTGRHKIVSRYRSYHGGTIAASTVGGDWRRPPIEPGLAGVVHVLDLDGATQRSLIPRTLELEGNVGAVMLEPVVGHNGVLIPPPGYFQTVREACDAHGALLIVDEVLTGFGRTGRWFGFEHFDDITPDLITLGKGLTGGYGALGAVLVHERVAEFFETETLVSGLTQYAHPLGVAAAQGAIQVYEEDGLVERAGELELLLRQALEQLCVPDYLSGARAIGLLGAVDLAASDDAWKRLPQALHARGVHAHTNPRARAVIVAPPLCIEADDLKRGVELIGHAAADALSNREPGRAT